MRYKSRTFLVFLLAIVFSIHLIGQLPSDIIILDGNVIELTSQSDYQMVSEIPFVINKNLEFYCDEAGAFSVRLPFETDKLSIDIGVDEYEIIQPKDGSHFIEASISPNSKYSILIVIVSVNLDAPLKQEIVDAQGEIERLRGKNKYSDLQLQKLNRQFIDSIQIYRNRERAFADALTELNIRMQKTGVESNAKTDSIENLHKCLGELTRSNDKLMERLSVAMEKKYLAQKNIFETVTKELKLYISRTKDVRDHLKDLDLAIKSNNLGYYYAALTDYSDVYEELEANRDDHANDIIHYWESNELGSTYTELTDYLIENIHKEEMLALNNGINHELRQASSGKRMKMKHIKKESKRIVEQVDEKITYISDEVDLFLREFIIF